MFESASENSGSVLDEAQKAGCLLISVVVCICGIACNADLSPGDEWRFGQNGTDASGPDVDSVDTGAPQTDAENGDPDTVDIEQLGWYRSTGSTALFSPVASSGIDDNYVRRDDFGSGSCDFRLADGVDRWRASGVQNPIAIFSESGPSGRALTYMRIRGEFDRGGPGNIDGDVRVQSAEVMRCQTSLLLGHCSVPRDGDRCEHVRPGGYLGNTLARYRLSLRGVNSRESRVTYVLQLRPKAWGGERSGIRWKLRLPGPGSDGLLAVEEDTNKPWYYQRVVRGLACPAVPDGTCEGLGRLSEVEPDPAGQGGRSVATKAPAGWMRVMSKPTRSNRERVRLSLKAAYDNGTTFHIWGTFWRTGKWESL